MNISGFFSSFYKSNKSAGAELAVKERIEWDIAQGAYPVIVCLGDRDYDERRQNSLTIVLREQSFLYANNPTRNHRLKWFLYHSRRFFNKKLAHRITKVFIDNNVKHVQLNDLSIASYFLPVCLSRHGISVTVFCHDYEWIMPSSILNTSFFNPIRLLRQWQARKAKPYIHKYIANSSFMKKCLVEVLGDDISCDIFYPCFNLFNWKKQRQPTQPGQKTITCIYSGTLVEHKGIVQFLNQIEQLQVPWLRIKIFGDGSQRSIIEEKVSERITYYGQVSLEEMRDNFAEGDFTIVPSLWEEPFGRVATESIASGCPVLAARRGGLIEQADIFPGILLYEPNDIGSLQTQLENMRELTTQHINAEKSILMIQEKNTQVLQDLFNQREA